MDVEIRSSIFNRVAQEGYATKLGMKLIEMKPGRAIVEMVPEKEDTNIFDMVHGGAIFSLMDEAFQVSCNSHGTVAVALSVNVTYHRAPSPESTLRAEAKEVARTRKTGNYYITVKDEQENLIASCQALAYRKEDTLPFIDD